MANYSKAYLESWAYIPRSEITDINSLKAELTIGSRFENGPVIRMYDDSKARAFGIPLYHERNIASSVQDLRTDGKKMSFTFRSTYRLGQKGLVDRFIDLTCSGGTGFILEAKAGFGKCHGKGVEVLLFDGSIKKVEDVVVGDLLIGPDSLPRKVLSLGRGRSELFKITPKGGEPFTCNAEHILSLQMSGSGEKVLRSLAELEKENREFKHSAKLWRSPIIFSKKAVPFDPYLVGLYIGDGSRKIPCLTLGDKDTEVIEWVKNWAYHNLYEVREELGQGCTMYHLTQTWKPENSLRSELLPIICVDDEKRIPKEYLINSEYVRLQVLAGLLDSDGYLVKKTVFDLVTKFKNLAEDVAMLGRSLGYRCTVSPCRKGCGDFSGLYYRVIISGDTDHIPCKLPRRQATHRKQKKDWRRYGFTVESIGIGDYFGFQLSGDGLYLLKDFMVTHNTVCLLSMLSILRRTALIVVPRSNLIKQWTDRAIEHTSLTAQDIGWVEGGKGSWRGKKLVIGLVHSLALDRMDDDFRTYFGVTVFDEVDRSVPPATFAPVVAMMPTKYRIGASATIHRPDGLHVIFEKHVGQYLLRGIDANRMKPKILMVAFKKTSGHVPNFGAKLNRRGMILSKLANNPERNILIADFIMKILRSGRRCLVLSDRTQQLDALRNLVLALGRSEGIRPPDVGFYVRQLTDVNGNKRAVKESERMKTASDCKLLLCCVTPDTECLTLAGWKKHTRLKEGELIASYDLKTDRIVYEPLNKVVSYDYDGTLCHVDRKAADILMTWNHRNVVMRPKGNIVIRTTSQLRSTDGILLTAPVDYPSNEGFPRKEWAELFGWVIAEGSYQYNSVKITQNEGKNARRIQWLLDTLGLYHTTWMENGKLRRWLLTVPSSKIFLNVAPDKLLNVWLASLPQEQLKVLFDALVAGDGHTNPDGRQRFIQKSRDNLNWFSVMAFRLGLSQVTTKRKDRYGCSVVYLTKGRRSVSLVDGKFKLKSVPYKGVVWCPVVTRTGTWVARRKGSVFITGNTYGMFSLGTDIPDLAALIYATPQSHIEQAQGRIERVLTGKLEPVIVDLVDTAYQDTLNWASSRSSFYRREGLLVVQK